jgi:hypothetical protein
MGDELEDAVRVINNSEIESPVLVDPRLPAVAGFIVLLGAQGVVVEVGGQEPKLFVKSPRALAVGRLSEPQ